MLGLGYIKGKLNEALCFRVGTNSREERNLGRPFRGFRRAPSYKLKEF